MTLTRRIKRLETQLGQDTFLTVSYADGQPLRCVHGRPKVQAVPPHFKGRILHLLLPTDWRGCIEATTHRNPRFCSCEADGSHQAGGL